jgi:hypothetical protein
METSPNLDNDLELKGIPEHIRCKLIEMKIKLDGIESIVNKMDSKRDEDIQSGKIISNATELNSSTVIIKFRKCESQFLLSVIYFFIAFPHRYSKTQLVKYLRNKFIVFW